jgi:hypothetical protein
MTVSFFESRVLLVPTRMTRTMYNSISAVGRSIQHESWNIFCGSRSIIYSRSTIRSRFNLMVRHKAG